MVVFANGMQRSGSTLQYNIVRLLLEQAGTGVPHGVVAPERAKSNDAGMGYLTKWVDEERHHLVKMHGVHPNLRELLATGRTRVCYTYRDLRDAAVSRKIAFGDREGRLYAQLDRCVESYWKLKKLQEEYPGHFLWQRYRDLVSDLPAAVDETAAFFELALSREALEAVATECSLDSAKTRVDALKAQLSTVLNETRKQDPPAAGEILRLVGRGADLGVIGFNDDASLIGYNQVSHYQGEVGVWRKRLDARTREEIERRYGDWYDDAFGTDWADEATVDAPPPDPT